MTETLEPTSQQEAVVNFYEELGLSRDDSLEKLREALDLLKPEWQSKRHRAGAKGEQARQYLRLIEAAEAVFADEDSREAYDLNLARKRQDADAGETQVNWLGRAWSYYYVKDYGAAAVAARKAREQAPDNPMPYVVSAWVNLAELEVRRAKQDVDEAFVLDELGEDTADVQEVRGAVFYTQGIFDRAIQSFDRAYAKSADSERPNLLLRKGWAQEFLGEGKEAFASSIEGLTLVGKLPEGEVTPSVVEHLTECAKRSADYVAGTVEYPDREPGEAPPPDKTIASYKELKSRVESAGLPTTARNDIVKHIDARAAVEELRKKIASLTGVQAPGGPKPGLPVAAAGAGVFFLLLTGAWGPAILIALGLFAWAGYGFSKWQKWGEQQKTYEQAQRDLTSAQSKFESRSSSISTKPAPRPIGRS